MEAVGMALLGGMAGLFVAWVWKNVRHRGTMAYRAMAPVSLKSGVNALFSDNGTGKASFVVLQVTMRPHFPLVDLLYFEKLRLMLNEDTDRRAMIAYWASGRDWTEEQTEAYEESIRRYLGTAAASRCEFANGASLSEPVVLDDSFLDLLSYVSSDAFLAAHSRDLGVGVKSPCELNPGRDGGMAIRSLIVHVLQSTLVAQHLMDSVIQPEIGESDPLEEMALLMWELELDKLALIENMKSAGRCKRWRAIGGKTISYGHGRWSQPLPTKDGAIGVLDVDAPEVFSQHVNDIPRGAVRKYAAVSQLLVESRTGTHRASVLTVAGENRGAMDGDVGDLRRNLTVLRGYL